jgi:hypothetical protein
LKLVSEDRDAFSEGLGAHKGCAGGCTHQMNPTQKEIEMTTSDFIREPLELDARAGDGIDVRLFWHPETGSVTVSVFDTTHEQAFELVVDPAQALDAFTHPFAYAAFKGVPFETPLRARDEEPVAV